MKENAELLRRWMRILAFALLPATFIVVFCQQFDLALQVEALHPTVGRVAFIASNLVLTVVAHKTLGRGGLKARTKGEESFLGQARRIWHPLSVLVPASLAVLAAFGYYYSALQLSRSCFETLVLLLAIVMAHYTAIRVVRLSKKRLLLKHREERRKAQQEAAKAQTESGDKKSPEAEGIEIADEPIDIGEIDSGVRKVLRASLFVVVVVGLWFIWQDVFPALGVLDNIDLYGDYDAITLGDLALAIFAVGVTVFANRHIPSLLELTILQRTEMQRGERYAVTTVIRYLIIAIGVTVAFSTLGFGWERIQWAVAGLSVGLGFGLQEIFANFVSGLIILFERPIRLGDVVTVDQVSGTVTRIRIRSTTITDWDRKEYIVPNKEFIVGRLLNWTLSDSTNRIVIQVGVAYGSNTTRARELLVEIAKSRPEVLDTPEPFATFDGFGDSTLNLSLRCYIAGLDKRLATITVVSEDIDRRFKDEGIEIAFPQRDLHIRSGSFVQGAEEPAPAEQEERGPGDTGR